uniref:Uncharacterized protein n=1 Tax=Picea glauca TaxID=3330 RepID=A0A117NG99_PICGL|nr:hypothetical protein ABT39_MTgene1534 [Picea glauca]
MLRNNHYTHGLSSIPLCILTPAYQFYALLLLPLELNPSILLLLLPLQQLKDRERF